MGEGHNRMLTLTHSTQLKRFASDLMRILKSRPSKQICLSEFPEAYAQCLDKLFDIAHYGVCDINDMLSELLDSIVISNSDNDVIIAIPKRGKLLFLLLNGQSLTNLVHFRTNSRGVRAHQTICHRCI